MIERYIRCKNCQIIYLWNSYNRSRESCTDYCPECKEAVNAALQTIPRKFESRSLPTSEIPQFSDVTWENIVEWEEDLRTRRQTSLVAKRIGVGLFNLDTGDHMSVRWVDATSGAHQGVSFKVSSWDTNPEKTIEVGMEYDLANQVFTGEVWRYRYYAP